MLIAYYGHVDVIMFVVFVDVVVHVKSLHCIA